MTVNRLCLLAALAAAVTVGSRRAAAGDVTVLTDADAGVRVVCRNDETEDICLVPRGGEHTVLDEWSDNPRYIRVHDQNALDVGYWHFDLSNLDASRQVSEARFQVDAQSNSWGDTTVAVVAIVDPDSDWDLAALAENEIIGSTAPQSDWEPYAWTGDPDFQQRYNQPLPFLDEGTQTNSVVRILEEGILVENQDAYTEGTPDDAGNSYGGLRLLRIRGPGTGGSADAGDNIWPIKDAVDVDITQLVRWKLGQDSAYSTFAPKDRNLTLMVRTDFSGGNGFIRFIARESEFLGGELDLQPGRLVVSNGAGGEVKPLWAGDADQDYDFDQLDLVKVQVSAKYLTGQAATWGAGDWNGAPGGSQGSPPAGNGLFDQLDIIAALGPGHYLQGPYAAIQGGGQGGDEQTSIGYNTNTGEVWVNAPASKQLTSINIESAGGVFTGAPAANLGGSFDNDADTNIFKATFGSSFGSISFGNVAQAGLSEVFVLSDLTVVGSLAGGGALGDVDLIYVPEPPLAVLFGLAFLGSVWRLRRQRQR